MNQPGRPEALLRHPLAVAGAVIATTSAVVFVVLLIAALAGLFTNQYAGLVVFVAIPIVATAGAALIPLGMWLQRRRLKQHPDAPSDWPVWDFRDPRVRRLALLLVVLAAVNGTVMLLAGYSSLHWMDSPGFCGQTCHTPMHPQYTAWQTGPHARIACASCHIGEGASGFVHAKLNGVHQLVAVTTDTFARPIPAGAVQPAGGFGGTCGSCHQAGRIPGDIVRVLRSYGDDEKNTETQTVLLMHVGRGSPGGHGIHWHADPGVNVEYTSTGAGRQTIPYVRVTSANGQVKEFFAADAGKQPVSQEQLRRMDCVDCHNMVGHRIWPTAEQAVDEVLAASPASRQLPFARRESVRVLKAAYTGDDEALQAIDRGLRGFYASHGGVDQAAVATTIETVQGVYRHNNFPTMKVTWGTYPDNTGHTTSNGCFRCHDGAHAAKDGTMIPSDCDFCHKQVDSPPA
jgi:nitrate/TMAO reductase-like tetraheme cytochrome c subunit